MTTDNDELGDFQPAGTGDSTADIALRERMEKLKKKIPMSELEDLESLDVDGLKKRIVSCQINLKEVDAAKDADDQLAKTRERLKEFAAPYNDAKKLQTAIAALCACLLDEKGAA